MKRFGLFSLLRRFLSDEDGSYLLYMSLGLPVIIGFASFASEGSLLLYNHRNLQSAIDAAAYSVAVAYSNNPSISSADMTTQAKAIVSSYGFVVDPTGNNPVNVTTPTKISNYAGSTDTAIQVIATRPQSPIFSVIWLKSNPIVGASATAIVSGGGSGAGSSGNCLLALGNTATGNNAQNAIQVQGGGGVININVPGCGVFSNSTDCSNGAFSVSLGGNAKVNAGSLGAAGCIDVFGHASVTLPDGSLPTGGNYTQQNASISNPYAGTNVPTTSSAGSCVPTAQIDSKGSVSLPKGTTSGTLCPGVYPNGITVKGNTLNITLQPGIYVLETGGNSPFQVGPGGGTVTGNGVTLVFTSATPNTPSSYPATMMSIQSNSSVTLTAPTSGTTAGFVIMGDSTMPLGTSFDTHSNPSVSLSGLAYLPRAALSWGGNPSTGSSQCLEVIANTITISGDSAFSNAGCTSGGGGSGSFGLKPIGSKVTLVN
jgi:hypothetical protein